MKTFTPRIRLRNEEHARKVTEGSTEGETGSADTEGMPHRASVGRTVRSIIAMPSGMSAPTANGMPAPSEVRHPTKTHILPQTERLLETRSRSRRAWRSDRLLRGRAQIGATCRPTFVSRRAPHGELVMARVMLPVVVYWTEFCVRFSRMCMRKELSSRTLCGKSPEGSQCRSTPTRSCGRTIIATRRRSARTSHGTGCGARRPESSLKMIESESRYVSA